MCGTLVPEHGVVELERLDGFVILYLFFQESMERNMHERIDFVSVELAIRQNIGKFKLVKILVRVCEHNFGQSSLFLVKTIQVPGLGPPPDIVEMLPIRLAKSFKSRINDTQVR